MTERPAPYDVTPRGTHPHDDPNYRTYQEIERLSLNLAPSLLTADELEELRALLERLVRAGHDRRAKR